MRPNLEELRLSALTLLARKRAGIVISELEAERYLRERETISNALIGLHKDWLKTAATDTETHRKETSSVNSPLEPHVEGNNHIPEVEIPPAAEVHSEKTVAVESVLSRIWKRVKNFLRW